MRFISPSKAQFNSIIDALYKELSKGTSTVSINLDKLLSFKSKQKLQLEIAPEVYLKMNTIVQRYDKELAWHFVSERIDKYHIKIYDILIYPQTTTSVTVESDDEEYGVWLDALDDDTFNHIRGQGHSHVNMGVTPSSTDLAFYELLIQHINDYYVFLIFNKKGEHWVKIYDFTNGVIFEKEDVQLVSPLIDVYDWVDNEIDDKLTTTTVNYGNSYSGFGYGKTTVDLAKPKSKPKKKSKVFDVGKGGYL